MMKVRSQNRGFILLEVMLAVMIFVIGVLALGHCVENCLQAEVMKEDDARARRLLENRMVAIEAGAIPLSDSATEDLKPPFAGMTLKTKRTRQKEKNEKDQQFELELVSLHLTWKVDGAEQSRDLEFYVRSQQR